MTEPGQAPRFEPRWPVALAILGVIGLLTLLPGRIRLFPGYSPYVLAIVVLAPIVAIELTKGSARWRRIERIVTALFVVTIAFGNLANLANLIVKVQEGATDISGLQLFASSIAVWITNVLAFAMLYWHLDRKGPEARMNETGTLPDWLFPQEEAIGGEGSARVAARLRRLPVPQLLDRHGVQRHRCPADDIAGQGADDDR